MTAAARDDHNVVLPLPRIMHVYAGAQWVQDNLDATHAIARRSNGRHLKCKAAKTMSPLGVAVAEVLGFVWRGIYHMDIAALMRVRWDEPDLVEVRVRHGLATFDGGELTWLVIVCHDMMLRMEIDTHGPRHLLLRFWQRRGREGYMHFRMPTLERHAELLRGHYTIEAP